MGSVRVVRSDELIEGTAQTDGLLRQEAISATSAGSQRLWMGRSVLEAGGRTAPHHHGESETAVYVVSGRGRWRLQDKADSYYEAGPGDFVLIPAYLVHWEENSSGSEPVAMIVARSGPDASVANLDVGETERDAPSASGTSTG
jgi:uncharacterized RmlC-like cupin family protein